MLRDGLNLYMVSQSFVVLPQMLTPAPKAVWLVNMVNMLFWFIIKPTGPEDPIRVIVTSMAAVLTTSMTLRIILAVRGPLANGGAFAVHSGQAQASTHAVSRPAPQSGPVLSLQHPQHTFTLGLAAEPKARDWTDDKESDQIAEVKGDGVFPIEGSTPMDEEGPKGVHITVDTETDYEGFAKK